jgi:rubrerythrin
MPFILNLQTAINNALASGHFYKELKNKTNNPIYQEFIEKAESDKKKHYELLQYVYYLSTGAYFQVKKEKKAFSNFREGVLIALKSELREAELYRDLLMEIPDWQAYRPIFLAMTDAPGNAVRFSCIYNALK